MLQMLNSLKIVLVLSYSILSTLSEERLSWFTKDVDVKRSIFVPENLSEGKEENLVLPWVFHSDDETKVMRMKCIMRGYNASNNPSDYKNARWSHPGFDDSQVDTSAPAEMGDEDGVALRHLDYGGDHLGQGSWEEVGDMRVAAGGLSAEH